MSGGYFDYTQNLVYSEVVCVARENLLSSEFYEARFSADSVDYAIESFMVLVNSYIFSYLAFVHIQRADWFLSGDDNFESYETRSRQDLEEVNIDNETVISRGSENLINFIKKLNLPDEKLAEKIRVIEKFKNSLI